jgi:hypothetical protein
MMHLTIRLAALVVAYTTLVWFCVQMGWEHTAEQLAAQAPVLAARLGLGVAAAPMRVPPPGVASDQTFSAEGSDGDSGDTASNAETGCCSSTAAPAVRE